MTFQSWVEEFDQLLATDNRTEAVVYSMKDKIEYTYHVAAEPRLNGYIVHGEKINWAQLEQNEPDNGIDFYNDVLAYTTTIPIKVLTGEELAVILKKAHEENGTVEYL